MEITKIDNDTFQIKTETIEEVSLSQLEQELAELKEFNASIEQAEKDKELLPENIKRFVMIPGVMMTEHLENRIKQLKNL
jgi:multidrug resistance efflux pump